MTKYKKIKRINLLILTMTMVLTLGIFFSGSFKVSAAEPVLGNYYLPDYETKEEAFAAGQALNNEIFSEGATLLKNENDALPLAENSRISLFGKSSNDIVWGGSGSGGGSEGERVTVIDSLNAAGFIVNPTLVNFYNDTKASGIGRGPTGWRITSGYQTGETPISMYPESVKDSYDNYNDAAVVVFSRIGGESFDLPQTMLWDGSSFSNYGTSETVPGARSGTDHYFQLDKNETDLLKHLGDNFNKVIILLNTGSQFEVGFLDDPNHYAYHENIKAGLWIGYPGATGLSPLGQILKGEINPSGKTVDTYARDFKQDPTWFNFGSNVSSNTNHYTNSVENRNHYVYYQEGIYVGYRYYETRGFTEGNNAFNGKINGTTTENWDNWYQAHVVYPFGHGLSYTTFSQEIIDQTPAVNTEIGSDDTILVTVKVTNTGDVAGKDIIQLYYTAPYINGEIEKSHVVLGAFEKTKLLAPSESETITLSLKVRDMASYDYNDANNNNFKGYELDQGTYSIKIMRNANEVIDSVDYTITNNIQILTDEETDYPIENRFDDVSEGIDVYVSRADFTGTLPTESIGKTTLTQELLDEMAKWVDVEQSDEGMPYYTDKMPTTGNNSGDIKLPDLIGLDYEDPLWQEFLDQISLETLIDLVGRGSYKLGMNIPTLGIPNVPNGDGPAGWSGWPWFAQGSNYNFYASGPVLASTWNKELNYRKGIEIGNEALFGNGGEKSRFPGWYAPAVNLHRSPFGGRNFEYYSEDGYLSGILAAETVKGAQEKGLMTFVKHFAINDQETNRAGILTWANEQSMRELYLKPFEITVKEGEARAMMSSYNRLGTTWAGGHYGLLTEVLRNEWGFKGTVVTDLLNTNYFEPNQMVRAGGDVVLGTQLPDYALDSPTTVAVLRKASHNILYTLANSMAMNTGYSTLPPVLNPYLASLLNSGIVGIEYNANIATASINKELLPGADDSEIKYSLKPGSILPEGLTLSEDGVINGTVNEEVNNNTFIVQAKYLNNIMEATFTLSFIDINGSIVYQAGDPLGIIMINEEYEVNVATAEIVKPNATQEEIDNFPPITYAIKNGSFLPAGLTISANGIISGIPTKEADNYQFTIVASASGYRDREVTYTISIYNELLFGGKILNQARFGTAYSDQVVAAISDKQVTYRLKDIDSLPQGLRLTRGGYIVGTPTVVLSDYKFTVIAEANFARPQEAEYTITIGIAFNNLELPNGKENEYYDTTIAMAQGRGDIEYQLKQGSELPEGLTLTENGNLSGTPTTAGVYELIFTATSEGFTGDELTTTLFIANEPPVVENGFEIIGMNGYAFIGIIVGVVAIISGAVVFIVNKKRKSI